MRAGQHQLQQLKPLSRVQSSKASMLLLEQVIIFKNLQFACLTPKGPRGVFLQNAPNLPFLAQEAQMNFFSLFFTFNCRILH
jgi:hypothetical protein